MIRAGPAIEQDRELINATAAVDELLYAITEELIPDKVLGSLLSQTERFYGEKDLLLTAFYNWILFPKDLIYIRATVASRLLQILDFLERRWIQSNPEQSALASYISVRNSGRFDPLFGDLYKRLGGLRVITRQRAIMYSVGHTRKRRAAARNVYRLIALMHYQIKILSASGRTAGDPSLNKAIASYLVLFPKTKKGTSLVGDRQLRSIWSNFRPTLSFLYAGLAPIGAADILSKEPDFPRTRVNRSQKPLLYSVYSGDPHPAHRPQKELLPRLLARARYTQEVILAKCPRASTKLASSTFHARLVLKKYPPPS